MTPKISSTSSSMVSTTLAAAAAFGAGTSTTGSGRSRKAAIVAAPPKVAPRTATGLGGGATQSTPRGGDVILRRAPSPGLFGGTLRARPGATAGAGATRQAGLGGGKPVPEVPAPPRGVRGGSCCEKVLGGALLFLAVAPRTIFGGPPPPPSEGLGGGRAGPGEPKPPRTRLAGGSLPVRSLRRCRVPRPPLRVRLSRRGSSNSSTMAASVGLRQKYFRLGFLKPA